jgi:hypothetical protein
MRHESGKHLVGPIALDIDALLATGGPEICGSGGVLCAFPNAPILQARRFALRRLFGSDGWPSRQPRQMRVRLGIEDNATSCPNAPLQL